MVDRESIEITINRQCELLELPRSSYYYKPCSDSPFNLNVMRLIDELYTKYPFYGTRRMSFELKRMGCQVGRDLVRSLMLKMGISALYPKPNLSKPHADHKVYPYLLRGVSINQKDLVWSTDITYIRMQNGFLYLTAVMDWYARCILSWKLSNSLEGSFCRETLLEALERGKPQIFNTDQGSQFTSNLFTQILEDKGIKISMDGRGRALDNVFIERFWRTVKQEEVYLNDYKDGLEARERLATYIHYYNNERPHSSLGYIPPMSLYESVEKRL